MLRLVAAGLFVSSSSAAHPTRIYTCQIKHVFSQRYHSLSSSMDRQSLGAPSNMQRSSSSMWHLICLGLLLLGAQEAAGQVCGVDSMWSEQ